MHHLDYMYGISYREFQLHFPAIFGRSAVNGERPSINPIWVSPRVVVRLDCVTLTPDSCGRITILVEESPAI